MAATGRTHSTNQLGTDASAHAIRIAASQQETSFGYRDLATPVGQERKIPDRTNSGRGYCCQIRGSKEEIWDAEITGCYFCGKFSLITNLCSLHMNKTPSAKPTNDSKAPNGSNWNNCQIVVQNSANHFIVIQFSCCKYKEKNRNYGRNRQIFIKNQR